MTPSKYWYIWPLAAILLMLSGCGNSGSDSLPPADTESEAGCDCPSGFVCDDFGNCLISCSEDADCPVGQFCNTAIQACQDQPSDGDFDAPPYPGDGDSMGDDEKPPIDGDLDTDIIWETDIEHDAANPWIQVEPRSIDFGAVPPGSLTTRSLTLMNLGDEQLDISDIYLLTDSDEFILDHPDTTFSLVSEQSQPISVTYEPLDDQADTNMLVIASNDPSEPHVGIPLYTEIKDLARLLVVPDPIEFGLVRMEQQAIEVSLQNDSGVDLHVEVLHLTDDSNEAFALTGLPEPFDTANPIVIGPRDSFTFQTSLSPDAIGEYVGRLEVGSDDQQQTTRFVDIHATVCEPEIEADPESYPFVGVDIGEEREESVTIGNSGCYPLELSEIYLGAATTADYRITAKPEDGTVLEQDETALITVLYRPDGEDIDVGSVVVTSNDADEPKLILPFDGDPTPPDIEVNPEALHFEALAAGASVIKTITIRNAAFGGLLILEDFELETEGTVFYKASIPVDQLGPGQSTIMKIGYQPDDATADTGVLRIRCNDPDPEESVLEIPLTGDGIDTNICPIADAGEGAEVEPLQTIQLDGTASSDPDGEVVAYLWEVIDSPLGSRALPVPMNAAQPTFFFDLAGEYTIQLQVRDDRNTWSCEADTVSYNAVPGEKIHIQLIWDTDNTDMDLHLVRAGGDLWDGFDHGGSYPVSYSDCFFSTCKEANEPTGNPVNWDNCGHPSLDIDDENGYGPENINLNDPCDGDYTIFVHYWNARSVGASTATVRIYIQGNLRHQESILLAEEHLMWDVAAIRWMADEAVILDHDVPPMADEHGQ